MQFIKIFLILFLVAVAAFSAPALQRVVTFTQPDGTKFQGVYKGDAAFHWIESNGNIVVYNPKDKYYYKAVVNKTKGLVPTSEKPTAISRKVTSLHTANSVKKALSDTDKINLSILHKKAKIGNYPR